MLTTDQVRDFDERGLVRIPKAFDATQAAAMADRVWAELESGGARRDDPSTWGETFATGLQGIKDDPVFAPIGGAATTGALDTLLGAGRWRRPRQWGQLLVSYPAGWTSASAPKAVWHADFAYDLPADPVPGALVFSFLADTPPGVGGTLVLEGSHRLVRRFTETQPASVLRTMKTARHALLQSDPWLRALTPAPDDASWPQSRLGEEHEVDGVRLRIAELSGGAGDLVIGHPWLLHTPAPNRGEVVRMMRVQRIHRFEDDEEGSTP